MPEIVEGQIVGADADGLLVRIPYSNWQRFVKRRYSKCLCELPDERSRTAEQIRLMWALMTEIGAWAGYSKAEVDQEVYRKFFAPRFVMDILPSLRKKAYHISSSTEEEATAFIGMLIDFCVENGVPTAKPLTEYTDDIPRYVYACLMNKKCAVCGAKADLHHVDRVGMGRDRNDINHIGMECLPLCRLHHEEAHTMTDEEFLGKYHLKPIKIDEEIASRYRLNVKEKRA